MNRSASHMTTHPTNTATLDHRMTSPLVYDPPGPGAWTLDNDHQAIPRGELMQELFAPNFVAGFREWFGRYGMPLDRLEGRHVHGWFFSHPVPAGVPDTGKAPPPTPVLKVLTRLVPELRRRRRTAAEAIADRRWLADARTWAAERDGWVARCEELLGVDLAPLDDAAVAEHVRRAHALASEMLRRHFSLIGPAVAIGRLLVAGRRWELDPGEVVGALDGGSPASSATRAPLAELAALAAGRAVDTADALRSISPRAAELVDDYLRRFGWRPLGGDVEAPTLAEHPDQLAELVRAAATTAHGATRVGRQSPIEELRGRLPAPGRAELDQLVAEARACLACLDDHSGMTAWALGVLRRAVLEVGRRAVDRGAVTAPEDAFNMSASELITLAAGGAPVGADELASRRNARALAAHQPPPPVLGGPVVEPPDPAAFPRPLGELAAAVGAFLGQKFTAAPGTRRPRGTGSLTVDGHASVFGVPVVAGTASGRVVVSRDPSDVIATIEPGDILVCAYTTAAHNAVFPMLGGVVTQFGGPLGHTAITARELGIPAVVGTGSLPVHLDGLHGELSVAFTTS